jgi:hypothetical protein
MRTTIFFVATLFSFTGCSKADYVEQCQWEKPGDVRVTLSLYKHGERYYRKSDIEIEVLNVDGIFMQSLFPGQHSYWSIRAIDSEFNPVAENDYIPPVINLSAVGDGQLRAARSVPQPGADSTRAPDGFHWVPAGTRIVEHLDWDRFLLNAAKWDQAKTYRIRHNGAWFQNADSTTYITPFMGYNAKCILKGIMVVTEK